MIQLLLFGFAALAFICGMVFLFVKLANKFSPAATSEEHTAIYQGVSSSLASF